MDFKLYNGSGNLSYKGVSRPTNKLNTYDWLADVPGNEDASDMVEVQFKNTRKDYYRNSNKIDLQKGDIVAVEASPGHDIGVVTLTGKLVQLQIKKANSHPNAEVKRVYRIAKTVDIEKYEEAKAKEHATMIKSREIAAKLNLDMKIGDVEYQGDGNKAIFYYIADGRVDFRQLIKDLAGEFRIRIEMKQIGARQEAGRIGGIGPCGRELCCASWMRNFVSVSTNAARIQDISLNPQKLAGQCAKLKCCLNYEVDAYVEAQKKLPSREVVLEAKDGSYYFFKADILNNLVTYSTSKHGPENLITITGKKAFDVIFQNRKGRKPDLSTESSQADDRNTKPVDLLEQESLTRFDPNKKERGNKSRRNNRQQDNRRNNKENQDTRSNREEKDNRNNNRERRPRTIKLAGDSQPKENQNQDLKRDQNNSSEQKDNATQPRRRNRKPYRKRKNNDEGKNTSENQ